MKIKYKLLFSFLFFIIFSSTLKATEETIIDLETEKSMLDVEKEIIEARDGVVLKYGDIKIRSDVLKKIEGKNILFSYGNVVFSQGNQVVKASEAIFNMDTKQTKILNSESYDSNLKLRFGGKETFSEGTEKISIKDGWFTPSPYENPTYKINAEELIIYPNKKLIAKNMAVNVKGKNILKIPYYITSLKPESQRATLFPFIGSDSDKGLYGIWGFDYSHKDLVEGFVDFELSEKKKIAIKTSNDYTFGNGNSGNLSLNRFTIPLKKNQNEWDISWKHSLYVTPKTNKIDRKFLDLGYGIWSLGYKNTTTNLMKTVDGEKLIDTQNDYIDKYKKIGFYDIKINQEIGKNGEINFDYYWTQNREALKELTKINDDIVYFNDLNPVHTDVDLYRKLKYTNGNDDVLIKIDNEDFLDVNPGYVGDTNSYRKKHNYLVNMRGPKIQLEYLDLDEDKYGDIFGMKERDDDDPYLFENRNDRWLKIDDYNKKKEWNLTFGNYYPFRKNEFFGYKPKTLSEYLTNNFYFGVSTKHAVNKAKVFEYDYTRDNYNFDNFFKNSNSNNIDGVVYNDDRVYKIYENSEQARRAKKIIDEEYYSEKINVGNDKIDLPIKNSFISLNYELENRNYKDVYVPDFSGRLNGNGQRVDIGRKLEDNSSKTGYKLALDSDNNTIKLNPKMRIHKVDTKLFTTLFDNTDKINNEYDVKVTNEIGVELQKTEAQNVMYQGYDVIETPTNAFGIGNDFTTSLGNVTFNYKFFHRNDRHFKDKWKKEGNLKNYFKIDIDNRRFVSANFENQVNYEFKDYKNSESFKKDFQYGYKTENDNNFLYKFSRNVNEYYPYNEILGWNNKEYKEKNVEKIAQVNYNEWGIEYSNKVTKLNDLFYDTLENGKPELKSRLNSHRVSFIYDTSKMKNKEIESDHYIKVGIGTGEKEYRDLNETPLVPTDDIYVKGKDYFNFGILYRYENNSKSKYVDNLQKNSDLATNKYDFNDTFNLNEFNKKVEEQRKLKKYFEVGMDIQLDGKNSKYSTDLKGLDRINDLTFKVEGGYLEKINASYRFIMERPDRIYRNDSNRKSSYNYRKHDLEVKYSFGADPDKPWWVGTKFQYVQNGAPKASDPEIYESSNLATKVNKLTLGMVTLSHRAENVEWEVGGGMKWDKPSNKKVGYYPVVSLKFSITPFKEKSIEAGFEKGKPKFGVGL